MASKIKVDQLETADGSGTIALQNQLSGLTSSSMPTGSVLQVVSATKTDTWTYTGTNVLQDVTGLSVSITPKSTSSKIFIQVNINITSNERYGAVNIVRDSTHIGGGASSGSRASVNIGVDANDDETGNQYLMRNSSTSYLDSPNTTSATTYKVQAGNTHSTGVVTYINRSVTDGDANWGHRGGSTITVMEIAG